jgi:anti-anti-sigma factor
MQATVIDHGSHIAVLRLVGELDADTAGTMHRTLARLVERPVPRIVVDLAGLTFCDSIGLSAFITSKHAINDRGGWLRFAGTSPFMAELFTAVGLSRHFMTFRNVAEALAA